MNITAVVIIYSSTLKNSATLQSIINCNLENIKLNICIWNNGPAALAEKDIIDFFSLCKNKNIIIDIYQDTRNIALSKIYNYFITNCSYDFITLLDQDSVVPDNFLINIAHHPDADLILPKIIVTKNNIFTQTDPHIVGDINVTYPEGKIDGTVDSVMSGLSLSQNATNKIISFRGYVFEERLAFYGIDSDFFRIVNIMNENLKRLSVYCSNEIHHSFAMFDSQEAQSEFRIMEMFYFKYFIRIEWQKKSTLSTLWICIRDFLRRKTNFNRMKNLILFTLNGKHPRSSIILTKKITYSHTNNASQKHYYENKNTIDNI